MMDPAYYRIEVDGYLEYDFDAEAAIGQLFEDGAIMLGGAESPFFEPRPGSATTIWINCNDLWALATADAERLDWCDIESFYQASCDPRPFALTKWICARFSRRPMPEIIRDMKAAGVWEEVGDA